MRRGHSIFCACKPCSCRGGCRGKRLPLWEKLYKKGDKEDGMMYGTIRIKLAERLQVSGMSKNKLGQKAEMQRTQINHYCSNRITRLEPMYWRGYVQRSTVRSVIYWNIYPRKIRRGGLGPPAQAVARAVENPAIAPAPLFCSGRYNGRIPKRNASRS